jgi:hypothetical protein
MEGRGQALRVLRAGVRGRRAAQKDAGVKSLRRLNIAGAFLTMQ